MNRHTHARLASLTRWAREADRQQATAPARRAFLDRFERQVDPDGVLDPAERTRRAAYARRAYMLRLAAASARARAARKQQKGGGTHA